jgi:hypothetical protein
MGAPYNTQSLLGLIQYKFKNLYSNIKQEGDNTINAHTININLSINNYGQNEIIKPICFIK